jgi:hypothetical protein
MSNHPKAEPNQLLRLDNQDQLTQFLEAPTLFIAETLTGILSAEGDSLKLASGKVVQAVLKGRLLSQLGKQIHEFRQCGKIKEDYFATHNQQSTLHELLSFIDESAPDEEVFGALKSIFFCAIEQGASDLEEQRAYQFLQICKQLKVWRGFAAEVLLGHVSN